MKSLCLWWPVLVAQALSHGRREPAWQYGGWSSGSTGCTAGSDTAWPCRGWQGSRRVPVCSWNQRWSGCQIRSEWPLLPQPWHGFVLSWANPEVQVGV